MRYSYEWHILPYQYTNFRNDIQAVFYTSKFIVGTTRSLVERTFIILTRGSKQHRACLVAVQSCVDLSYCRGQLLYIQHILLLLISLLLSVLNCIEQMLGKIVSPCILISQANNTE